jgi:hypothetical protein
MTEHSADTDTHKGFLGLYTGPIKKGMTFIWEPNRPHARELITVVRVQDRENDEAAIWTCEEVWNHESRFREAVVALNVEDAAKVRKTAIQWLKLIRDQDQGCGGRLNPQEIYQAMKREAANAIIAIADTPKEGE